MQLLYELYEERRSQPERDMDQRNNKREDLSVIGEIKDCYRESKVDADDGASRT